MIFFRWNWNLKFVKTFRPTFSSEVTSSKLSRLPKNFEKSDSSAFTFSEKEKASNAKYVSKVIAVSGTIDDITTDEKGDQVILIAGSSDMMNGVLCTLEKSEADKAKSLKRGDEVTIKGRCTGMLMDVVLNKCTIQ